MATSEQLKIMADKLRIHSLQMTTVAQQFFKLKR